MRILGWVRRWLWKVTGAQAEIDKARARERWLLAWCLERGIRPTRAGSLEDLKRTIALMMPVGTRVASIEFVMSEPSASPRLVVHGRREDYRF